MWNTKIIQNRSDSCSFGTKYRNLQGIFYIVVDICSKYIYTTKYIISFNVQHDM